MTEECEPVLGVHQMSRTSDNENAGLRARSPSNAVTVVTNLDTLAMKEDPEAHVVVDELVSRLWLLEGKLACLIGMHSVGWVNMQGGDGATSNPLEEVEDVGRCNGGSNCYDKEGAVLEPGHSVLDASISWLQLAVGATPFVFGTDS